MWKRNKRKNKSVRGKGVVMKLCIVVGFVHDFSLLLGLPRRAGRGPARSLRLRQQRRRKRGILRQPRRDVSSAAKLAASRARPPSYDLHGCKNCELLPRAGHLDERARAHAPRGKRQPRFVAFGGGRRTCGTPEGGCGSLPSDNVGCGIFASMSMSGGLLASFCCC